MPGPVTITAQPIPYTWLALDRYRQWGLTSVISMGPSPPPFFSVSGCKDVFYKYGWQDDERVSRDEIARTIKGAEDDIAQAVGFPLAPTLHPAQEVQLYPEILPSRILRRSVQCQGSNTALFGPIGIRLLAAASGRSV